MKKLIIISCFILSACGTANTVDFGQYKEITFKGFTQSPYQHEVVGNMQALSMKECQNGYTVLNQRQSSSPRFVVWKIKCN